MSSASPSLSQPAPVPERVELALTPRGHLTVVPSPDADELAPALLRRIQRAFELGTGPGLFQLGAVEVSTALPPAFAFFRDFAASFVSTVCRTPQLEELRAEVQIAPPSDLDRWLASAPPMAGAEYLSSAVLQSLWSELQQELREEILLHPGPVQALLTRKNAAWNVVGRIHFHLAENKRNPERPFAFLATYPTSLSPQGKPQHRPLGDAVRESSSAGDSKRLLTLLAPVQHAATRSPLVRAMVDSGELFRPQSWSPEQAYEFLQQAEVLEEAGVVLRLPDWWRARRRPQVAVAIGSREPSRLGADALLDFQVGLSLDGEAVTDAELRALGAAASGLVLLKGKWVELDRAKLDSVLAHWRQVQRSAGDGVSFIEGMRMLAGASAGSGGDALAGERAWAAVESGPWLTQTLAQLRSGSHTVDPGPEFRAELRPYQRQGVSWLWLLCQLRLGACLADDMGLGKTVQVLALLSALVRSGALKGPHLLVVPASLLGNWQAEAARFAPALRLFTAHPSVLDAKALATEPTGEWGRVDVVLTTYGTLPRVAWLKEHTWGVVVLDEAQAIKNPAIQQSRAVKALSCAARVALTGTPVENRAADLWSLFDFLNPGLLGTAKEFSTFLKRPASSGTLRALCGPYLLRRLKTDKSIIGDLPEKLELRAECGLSKRQAALYQEAVEALAQQLTSVTGIQRRGLVLGYLTRFKQICNHPSHWLSDGQYAPADSGKFERLRELCEVIAAKQEKALLFSQFAEIAAPLAAYLGTLFGRPGLILTGETPVKERQALVKRFQEDERAPFFVLSLKAGGTGLNLTAASHVIHFDRWWNPAVENQATDRAFRIGQTRNVLVHKLVCRGTLEERIDALIESKRGLARELLEDGRAPLQLSELSDEQLISLVRLDLSKATAEA